MLKLTQKRQKHSGDSTCFIPHIYHNWGETEINEYNFLLTKEIQTNFCICNLNLNNYNMCDNCTSKRPVIENKVCNMYVRGLVCATACH